MAPASRRYSTCAKAGKEGRGSRSQALLTDLFTGFLCLPLVHALQALPGAPLRSVARRLWRELECARGGRGDPKVGGRKNITALTPRGSSGSLGSWGLSQGSGASSSGPPARPPARRPAARRPLPAPYSPLPAPHLACLPAARRRREICKRAASASRHPFSTPHYGFIPAPHTGKLGNREKM